MAISETSAIARTEHFESDLQSILRSLFVPDELKKDFRTFDSFREATDPLRNSIFSSIEIAVQERFVQSLNDCCAELLRERQEIARKEHCGAAMEDAENFLDFALSNIEIDPKQVHPTAHGTICYYLFIREMLPPEFVREFETTSELNVPESLKRFPTYDRYFETPDQDLLAVFSSGNAPIREMRKWLLENIDGLAQEIRSKKPQPKKFSFGELLEREGMEKIENPETLEGRYRFLIHPLFRKNIEDDFGVELKDFPIRTQVQFLNFLFEKNEEEVKRVMKFMQDGNSTDRLKYFLSFEQGADMGEKILAIGEKLPKEAADTVFGKYAEMADRAGEARKNSEKDADAIETKLLRDDKNSGRYDTKRMTQEEVVRKSEADFKDASRIFLSVPERSFSRKSIEANLNDGFVFTRMFRQGEGEAAKVYFAFESEK